MKDAKRYLRQPLGVKDERFKQDVLLFVSTLCSEIKKRSPLSDDSLLAQMRALDVEYAMNSACRMPSIVKLATFSERCCWGEPGRSTRPMESIACCQGIARPHGSAGSSYLLAEDKLRDGWQWLHKVRAADWLYVHHGCTAALVSLRWACFLGSQHDQNEVYEQVTAGDWPIAC